MKLKSGNLLEQMSAPVRFAEYYHRSIQIGAAQMGAYYGEEAAERVQENLGLKPKIKQNQSSINPENFNQTSPYYQAINYYVQPEQEWTQQQQFAYVPSSYNYGAEPTNSQSTDLSELINQYSNESASGSFERELQELAFGFEELSRQEEQLSQTTARTTETIRSANESIRGAFQSSLLAQTLPQRDIQSTREPAQNQLPDATRAISGNQAGVDGYEYSAQQQGGRGIEIER